MGFIERGYSFNNSSWHKHFYAPEIKFYSNKLDNQKYQNLQFIGDCSGATRSIIYATAHGHIIGEQYTKS